MGLLSNQIKFKVKWYTNWKQSQDYTQFGLPFNLSDSRDNESFHNQLVRYQALTSSRAELAIQESSNT